MPSTDRWEWGNEGVAFEGDHLLWYEKEGPVRFASGGACEQTFDEFLKNGPRVDGVPPDIVKEVDAAVRKRVAGSESA